MTIQILLCQVSYRRRSVGNLAGGHRAQVDAVVEFFEGFVKIQGVQQYLWRAVDQNGEVVDVFL